MHSTKENWLFGKIRRIDRLESYYDIINHIKEFEATKSLHNLLVDYLKSDAFEDGESVLNALVIVPVIFTKDKYYDELSKDEKVIVDMTKLSTLGLGLAVHQISWISYSDGENSPIINKDKEIKQVVSHIVHISHLNEITDLIEKDI